MNIGHLYTKEALELVGLATSNPKLVSTQSCWLNVRILSNVSTFIKKNNLSNFFFYNLPYIFSLI